MWGGDIGMVVARFAGTRRGWCVCGLWVGEKIVGVGLCVGLWDWVLGCGYGVECEKDGTGHKKSTPGGLGSWGAGAWSLPGGG